MKNDGHTPLNQCVTHARTSERTARGRGCVCGGRGAQTWCYWTPASPPTFSKTPTTTNATNTTLTTRARHASGKRASQRLCTRAHAPNIYAHITLTSIHSGWPHVCVRFTRLWAGELISLNIGGSEWRR